MLELTVANSGAGRFLQSLESYFFRLSIQPLPSQRNCHSNHTANDSLSVLATGGIKWILIPRQLFLHLPSNLWFVSSYTIQMHINWIFLRSAPAVLSLPPEGACQTVVVFKVIANSKSQTALLLLQSSENTFMKSNSRSSRAALTQLLYSLCLILMSALGISLFLLIYNRLRWGRRTPK